MTTPRIEIWTEVRCPACTHCGWADSRLLFKIIGTVTPGDGRLQTRCHRCKSIIEWYVGTPRLVVVSYGLTNGKVVRAVFE